MLPFLFEVVFKFSHVLCCYITQTAVKLCKKKKIRIFTFVQVCAKRFRLCPTYKATSDKGSLLASYYFSKIEQSKKKS